MKPKYDTPYLGLPERRRRACVYRHASPCSGRIAYAVPYTKKSFSLCVKHANDWNLTKIPGCPSAEPLEPGASIADP